MTPRLAFAALGLALIAAPAVAQTAAPAPAAAPVSTQPAAAGVKLSDILAKIEGEAGFVRFDDIEWDNRDTAWEIDYLGTGGRKVSVSINGTTGEPLVQ